MNTYGRVYFFVNDENNPILLDKIKNNVNKNLKMVDETHKTLSFFSQLL